MGYGARGGSGYKGRVRHRTVSGTQRARSKWAVYMDNCLSATKAKDQRQWMNYPSRYDLPGVDTPKKIGVTVSKRPVVPKRPKKKPTPKKPKSIIVEPKKPISTSKVVVEEKKPIETAASFGFSSVPVKVKSEKPKVKVEHKTAKDTKMTYLERAHLLALAKKYNVDRAEIDHKLSYGENKEYLSGLAKLGDVSGDVLAVSDLEAAEWTGKYREFMDEVGEDSERWKEYFN